MWPSRTVVGCSRPGPVRSVRDPLYPQPLEDQIAPERASQVVNVPGKLVVPGLIDIHGHYAMDIQPFQADPDARGLAFGVTTAVDAGTVGWINFPVFRRHVMERVDTRLYAFLHLSSVGLSTVWNPVGIPDLEDFRLAREAEAIQCIQENHDLVLGVKVRLSPSGTMAANAVPAMEMARRICDQTGTRIMVHVMESPIPLEQVFRYLRPGDVASHIFHEDVHNVLDESDQILPEVWDAYKQGIVFDTANAMRHCSISVCRAVIQQGLLPHTISTDRSNPGPGRTNYSLPENMSMFLELGMSLEEVISSTTANAASAIGRDDLGTLKVGSVGDAAVLEMEQGDYGFEDQLGNHVRCSRQLSPVLTVKGGRQWTPRFG